MRNTSKEQTTVEPIPMSRSNSHRQVLDSSVTCVSALSGDSFFDETTEDELLLLEESSVDSITGSLTNMPVSCSKRLDAADCPYAADLAIIACTSPEIEALNLSAPPMFPDSMQFSWNSEHKPSSMSWEQQQDQEESSIFVPSDPPSQILSPGGETDLVNAMKRHWISDGNKENINPNVPYFQTPPLQSNTPSVHHRDIPGDGHKRSLHRRSSYACLPSADLICQAQEQQFYEKQAYQPRTPPRNTLKSTPSAGLPFWCENNNHMEERFVLSRRNRIRPRSHRRTPSIEPKSLSLTLGFR